jgi:hypothetical protein
MTDTRIQKTPGPDHLITVEPFASHVVVRSGSTVIAETDRALELREAAYPPVLYIPIEDVDTSHIRPTNSNRHRGVRPGRSRLVLRRPLSRRRRHQGPRGLLHRPGHGHRQGIQRTIDRPV